jgi:type II secretory pathway pseudopilin PulG
MTTRGYYLIAMLVLLFLANIAMLMGMTNWPQRVREGFVAQLGQQQQQQQQQQQESFMDYLVPNTFGTASIGSYDGLNLSANLPPAAQGFRGIAPDEPLAGPPITLDEDHLLIFTNNQCKPECCDSTLSCDGGGCVCTTPDQRDFINRRGNNRARPGRRSDDGF